MFQVDNKSFIIHVVYLLPMPLGTKKHYRVITTRIFRYYHYYFGTCDRKSAALINQNLSREPSQSLHFTLNYGNQQLCR